MEPEQNPRLFTHGIPIKQASDIGVSSGSTGAHLRRNMRSPL